MTHLLDTSAVIANYRREAGWDQVRGLLQDDSTLIAISALTVVEFEAWLRHQRLSEADRDEALRECVELVDSVAPVTHEIANLAVGLRSQATRRIPTADIVIAATAALADAVLVHRDAHFSTLPVGAPKQIVLPPRV